MSTEDNMGDAEELKNFEVFSEGAISSDAFSSDQNNSPGK